VDKTRRELGISAPVVTGNGANNTSSASGVQDDFDANDSASDSGHEESKGGAESDSENDSGGINAIEDAIDDTATEVFIPDTPFNSSVDYTIPATIEPFITVLLGKTIRSEVRTIDHVKMVSEIAKYLAMWTAPTGSALALLGYIKSVVLRVPSESLYDKQTGLSLVIHDTPGMVVNDALRAECSTTALKTELNSNDHAVIPHVVDNADAPGDVFECLSTAGVFTKLLTDPEALCVIQVFPSDKYTDEHERMDEESIDIIRENQSDTLKSHLTNRAASMQQAVRTSQCHQMKQTVDRAMNSVKFATVDTHPTKITAQLKGNTTAAQPDLSELKTALTVYTTPVWEKAQVTCLHKVASEVALQANLCYQANAILLADQQGSTSSTSNSGDSSGGSSSNTSSSSSKPWQIVSNCLKSIKRLLHDGVRLNIITTSTPCLLRRTTYFMCVSALAS
jgi:hypothetical protein